MTKIHVVLIVAALTLASGHVTAQDQREPNAAIPSLRPDGTPFVPAPSKRPFGSIFVTPRMQSRPQQPSEPQIVEVPPLEAQPRVVCGMRLVPTKPNLDPKMALQPQPRADVEYKLRVITPPVCRN